MRHLLLGLALISLSAQSFGQATSQEKPVLPVSPPLPLPSLLNPPPAAARGLTVPGTGLLFRNWRDLLKKDASSAESRPFLLNGDAAGWQGSGHCSVPLLSIPLPEHFDDPMIHKLPRHYDDKMLLPTPPVCPLHDERAESAKRK